MATIRDYSADYFEFKWNGIHFTFYVKPDIFVRPHAEIWDVVRNIRVDFDTTTIFGHSKHKSISIFYNANSNKSLEERLKEKVEPFLYRTNAYWKACDGWKPWNELCDRERKRFVRKHNLYQNPFEMEIENKLLEGDRVNGITVKKVINFIDKSCLNSNEKLYIPFSIEWTMTYNLDGHYNWRGVSGYIPDISKTSLLDLRSYENGYESTHGQMTIENVKATAEYLEGYSILKTVFDDATKYIPAFDIEDLETIFTSCNGSFWEKLADVNKYAFNVESYERSDKSISFKIEFGNGSHITVALDTEAYDTYDDCTLTIYAYCSPGGAHRTWKDSRAYGNLETYGLVSPSKVKRAIDWLLKEFNDSENIPDHLTEDISEVFFKKFEKEMPAMFRKKIKNNDKVELAINLKVIPSVEKIHINVNLKKEENRTLRDLICEYNKYINCDPEEAERIWHHIEDVLKGYNAQELQCVLDWTGLDDIPANAQIRNKLWEYCETLKKDVDQRHNDDTYFETLKVCKGSYERFQEKGMKAEADVVWAAAKANVDHLSRAAMGVAYKWIMDEPINNHDFRLRLSSYLNNCMQKYDDRPENSDLYKKLDYNMNMWFKNESLRSAYISNIENLILQSNNSGKTREIVSAWMSNLNVNGRFYEEVRNVYDIVTYIGSRESGIVRSDKLLTKCHEIAEHFKEQLDEDCHLPIWEYAHGQMNRSLEQLIRDICNPVEYGPTFAYYTGLVKDLEKGTEKELHVKNDNRPPLTDDWIRHNFNEINDRLKAMEGQVKGVNKSCSKMHESFNKLVKEMTDLYHGKDNELKLIQDCLERVERKLWPKEYEAMDKNPFAHWVLKATMKRPVSGWDCNKCKEDGTNGGNCEGCFDCVDGSEFTPIDEVE